MSFVAITRSCRQASWLCALALLLAPGVLSANLLTDPPERRVDQYPTENGYLILPLPYSIPGIGEGYFLMGYLSNVFGSTADAFVVRVAGDAEGYVAKFDEIPLIRNHLFLNMTEQRIDKAAVNNYKTRGVANGEDTYNIVEVNQADQRDIGLTLSLYERRMEYNATRTSFEATVIALRDSDGNLITPLDPPYHFKDVGWHHSLKIDLTDDYLDPRRGVRFDLRYQDVPPGSSNDADFYRIDAGMTLYIPFRNNDTLALNYYRSDAHVTDVGNVDPDAIRVELDFDCEVGDLACLSAEQNMVDMFINERTYGTATTLGGDNRLRAYPQGRFSGGHMAFAGAEYRWNFVQDAKPFDYYIWKDVTTTLQLAFFIEAGSVAETPSKLWDDYRTSYGIGGRLLSASGSVYRADIASGNEGEQYTIYFFYPWK